MSPAINDSKPNHTYKTCLVIDCDWTVDLGKDWAVRLDEAAQYALDLHVASHMIDHTPRELFTSLKRLNEQLQLLQAVAFAEGMVPNDL